MTGCETDTYVAVEDAIADWQLDSETAINEYNALVDIMEGAKADA